MHPFKLGWPFGNEAIPYSLNYCLFLLHSKIILQQFSLSPPSCRREWQDAVGRVEGQSFGVHKGKKCFLNVFPSVIAKKMINFVSQSLWSSTTTTKQQQQKLAQVHWMEPLARKPWAIYQKKHKSQFPVPNHFVTLCCDTKVAIWQTFSANHP